MQALAHRSMHTVLLQGTIVLLLVVLGAAAWVAYIVGEHEAEEVFDARLATSARVLDALVAQELETAGASTPLVIALPPPLELQDDDEATPLGHHYETKIAFQVWDEHGVLRMRSASAPATPFAPKDAGYSSQQFADYSWRVFALQSGGRLIQVAERDDIRDELCTKLALTTVLPLIAGIPLLLVFLSLLIRYGLAPLGELARRIEHREPASLEPVVLPRAPAELAPVVKALNGLFARVRDALARERRFTATAAHELRTPLAALKLHAENALRASGDRERQTSLQRMAAAMRRTVRLAEQMLAYSRASAPVDAVKLEPVALRGVVEDVLEEMQPQLAARGVRLTLSCEPRDGAFRVRGDHDKLASLTANLLENAIRYGPEQGAVRVDLTAGTDYVTLAISDEGPGIAPELRERIFESYFRVPGTREDGTGLGLAIVKEIAQQHGARVDVGDGGGGRGTRIEVRFQAIDPEPPRSGLREGTLREPV